MHNLMTPKEKELQLFDIQTVDDAQNKAMVIQATITQERLNVGFACWEKMTKSNKDSTINFTNKVDKLLNNFIWKNLS